MIQRSLSYDRWPIDFIPAIQQSLYTIVRWRIGIQRSLLYDRRLLGIQLSLSYCPNPNQQPLFYHDWPTGIQRSLLYDRLPIGIQPFSRLLADRQLRSFFAIIYRSECKDPVHTIVGQSESNDPSFRSLADRNPTIPITRSLADRNSTVPFLRSLADRNPGTRRSFFYDRWPIEIRGSLADRNPTISITRWLADRKSTIPFLRSLADHNPATRQSFLTIVGRSKSEDATILFHDSWPIGI